MTDWRELPADVMDGWSDEQIRDAWMVMRDRWQEDLRERGEHERVEQMQPVIRTIEKLPAQELGRRMREVWPDFWREVQADAGFHAKWVKANGRGGFVVREGGAPVPIDSSAARRARGGS